MTKTTGTTLIAGVKGTDNCPICGKTMDKAEVQICGTPFVQLTCNLRDSDHHTQILLAKDAYVQQRPALDASAG